MSPFIRLTAVGTNSEYPIFYNLNQITCYWTSPKTGKAILEVDGKHYSVKETIEEVWDKIYLATGGPIEGVKNAPRKKGSV